METEGIAQALNANINTYTQTSGLIDQRTTAINADLTSVQNQATQLLSVVASVFLIVFIIASPSSGPAVFAVGS